MKKLLILLLLISIQFSFGQNRFKPSTENITANDNVIFNKDRKMESNMSIIGQTSISKSEKGFFYLLEVKNTSAIVQNYTISSETLSCDKHKEHSEIIFSFYDASKTNQIKKLVVQPGSTKTFYVKTSIPQNTKSSTSNCSNILVYNPITKVKEVTKLVSSIYDSKNAH